MNVSYYLGFLFLPVQVEVHFHFKSLGVLTAVELDGALGDHRVLAHVRREIGQKS